MFLTIFVKKSFFWGAKKIFEGMFFVEVTKKMKNVLPDESRDQIGKTQEIWDWLVHPPQSGG